MKQPINKNDLLNQLRDQLDKIIDFSQNYDLGKKSYAKEIAVKLRVLFHNSKSSNSLLNQLNLEHIEFVDTSVKYNPSNLITTHFGLISTEQFENGRWEFTPYLKGFIQNKLSFEQWWDSTIIIVDKDRNNYTRKKLILELANTDGGAHVDGKLKVDYYELTRKNSISWFQVNNWGEKQPMENPVPPSIRQIAYEVIKTFDDININ